MLKLKFQRYSLPLLMLSLAACEAVMPWRAPKPLSDAAFNLLYATPQPPPSRPVRVFHLGHSLVGRDMPAMLQQLAGSDHRYESQLGWGTTLKAHWERGEQNKPIAGFETENAHPRYRDAFEAVKSGQYDAFVMTEMVEIRDAIKYYNSSDYLHRWARLAWDYNPNVRIYLYETWHRIDDPEGWLTRLDLDLGRYWEGEILRRALGFKNMDRPIYVIPAGQVFARFVRAIEERGGVDGLTRKEDLFSQNEKGEQDMIHVNDLGAYLVALTHYAVLYQNSPVGLPHKLRRADGNPATSPGEDAARLMQEVVWEVVTHYDKTGMP